MICTRWMEPQLWSITHLMYVDDVLMFTKANTKSVNRINGILEKYTTFSSLELNRNKSFITFSKFCEGNWELQSILGFQTKALPIMYLGVPITGKKKIHNQWELIQSIEKLLVKWSGKFFSFRGRIQFITWIVTGKYTYWAQVTSFPSSIVDKIRKPSHQFIWDGRKGHPIE